MRFFIKLFLIIALFISIVDAKKACIVTFSTKVVFPADKNIFLKRFPTGVISKNNGLYTFRLQPFDTYRQAYNMLPQVQKYYHDAFIINCNPEKKANIPTTKALTGKITNDITTIPNKTQITPVIPLNEPSLGSSRYNLPLNSLQVSNINKTPKLAEPSILEPYEIPKLSKTDQTQTYDILNFKRYIHTLFDFNDQAQESFYQKKIDYLISDIRKDRYNFDVYVDGYLSTGTSIAAQGGNAPNVNGDYTGTGIAINANKILYDGGYKLVNNEYDILNKRLADIEELNAKDRLAILGTQIYSNMYSAQEELKIYKNIYEKQKFIYDIIKNGYDKGKTAILDYIDSKNDLLNLERTIIDLKYQYMHNDYILRHSIKSRSKKPYKLIPEEIDLNLDSLTLLQKESIHNSGDIARESNILKVKQSDLLFQKRRYYPELRFESYLGYGLSRDRVFNLSNPGSGAYWELGLYFKLPIYNRDDIRLNKEREQYAVLQQKAVFSGKQRDILIQVERSYNEILRIKQQKNILDMQLKLLSKKMQISKERYLKGVAKYKEYSDSIQTFLEYKDQFIKIDQRYMQEISILSILVGKRDFYEQN
ncbi:MAG: TolC family protein [Sulfurospirillaceae bacterium]|nr:TolC family protein [Sulfurospirillaceae bacterium]